MVSEAKSPSNSSEGSAKKAKRVDDISDYKKRKHGKLNNFQFFTATRKASGKSADDIKNEWSRMSGKKLFTFTKIMGSCCASHQSVLIHGISPHSPSPTYFP